MLLRKEISFALAALFLATLASAERVKRMYALCPPNFIRIGSECYYISTEEVNWLDAHFACKDRNSRLAEPIKYEDRALRKYFVRDDDTKSDTWIGGIYNWERKKWQWGYNGHDIVHQSFSQMSPGSSQDLRFHCAVLNPQLKYRWSARSCVDKHHYICQHRMPYVTQKNRQKIYSKWNETFPNQMANEIEVVLSDEDLQSKMIRQRQNQKRRLNKNRLNPVNNDDRLTNSIDYQPLPSQPIRNNLDEDKGRNHHHQQQQQQQQQQHQRRTHPQRDRKYGKRLPNAHGTDVDNNIDDVNGNRGSNRPFHLSGPGLRPGGHRNRTHNPHQGRNNKYFRPHGHRTATTTTTTTSTTTTPVPTTTETTEPPTERTSTTTYLPPVFRHHNREPTSAEERQRIETEHVRTQADLRRREHEETIRQQEEYQLRSKNRQELEKNRAAIEDREAEKRRQQYEHEQRMEQRAAQRQQEERERMEIEMEEHRRRTELREQGPSSVEQQRVPVTPQTSQRNLNEVDREPTPKPIDDDRLEQLRAKQEKIKKRREEFNRKLQRLSPEQREEYYAKRAERNKKRGAKKSDQSISDK